MESNKENIGSKATKKTKIPVPMEPLPLLPKHLIMKNGHQERPPLKTIDNANIAANSHLNKTQRDSKKTLEKLTLKTYVRHDVVYSRIKKELTPSLNRDNINDNATGITVIGNHCIKKGPKEETIQNNCVGDSETEHDTAFIFIDDDEDIKIETDPLPDNSQNSLLKVGKIDKTEVTPASVINRRIRNIKKSLKRPHSRELQGLSPAVQEKTSELKVKRRLTFERGSSDIWKQLYAKCLTKDYTNDIFPYLQIVECKPRGVPSIASVTRTCIINWLLKINGPGGNPAVIQTACWYLDSYMSTKAVPLADLQIVSAACFWIAQKLHGPMFSATKMVLCGKNAFTAVNLRSAEMNVLQELKFPKQPVVAQEYIAYLSWWCDNNYPEEIEEAATFLCMAGLMVDKSLCAEYPSVIAAAAVKNAITLLGKIHLMSKLIMCPVYQACLLKFYSLPMASILRRAVRTISNPVYEYNILLEHYGLQPYNTAQRIIEAVNSLSNLEPPDTRKESVSFKL